MSKRSWRMARSSVLSMIAKVAPLIRGVEGSVSVSVSITSAPVSPAVAADPGEPRLGREPGLGRVLGLTPGDPEGRES